MTCFNILKNNINSKINKNISIKKKVQINSIFFKIICLLCALVVPLLVSGPFISDLVVSSLVLWFIYFSLKNKIYYVYKNIYFLYFIIFCGVCILSSLISDEKLFSLKSSIFYFRIGIFALLISFLIDQNKKILDYFYYSLIITFTGIVIDGYYQYFIGKNLVGLPIIDYRVSSFFGDELVLGSYLSRLFPLLFAIFISRKKKSQSEIFFISILFLLIDVLIFISGERTAFFLFNLSTIFIIIFISEFKMFRIVIFTLSIIVISLITYNDRSVYKRYIETPIQSMGLDNEDKKKYFFTPAHDSMIRTAYNMFLDKPYLGHGPKLFRVKCSDPSYSEGVKPCSTHPHNFYIQLLAETGLIGFSFLAGLFIFFIYIIINHIKEYLVNRRLWLSDYQICLLAGLLITIWPFTTSGNFFTNYLMMFYSLQMGFFRKRI